MTRTNDDQHTGPDDQQITNSPASPLEPTAVRAAAQADAEKDLPNADTDTKQTEKGSKSGRSSS